MGMYTEIFINANLKRGTPEDVISVLQAMCGGKDDTALQGRPDRWRRLFRNGSYYTPRTCCANLTFDEIANAWAIIGKGDIKNYGGEIEAFFDWIMPWIDATPGEFIGYKRYEESDAPDLVFVTNIASVAK